MTTMCSGPAAPCGSGGVQREQTIALRRDRRLREAIVAAQKRFGAGGLSYEAAAKPRFVSLSEAAKPARAAPRGGASSGSSTDIASSAEL